MVWKSTLEFYSGCHVQLAVDVFADAVFVQDSTVECLAQLATLNTAVAIEAVRGALVRFAGGASIPNPAASVIVYGNNAFDSAIPIGNVVPGTPVLAEIPNPLVTYFTAVGMGLVGPDRSTITRVV